MDRDESIMGWTIVFLIGFSAVILLSIGSCDTKKEAIDAGAGEYYIEEGTANKKFRWISPDEAEVVIDEDEITEETE